MGRNVKSVEITEYYDSQLFLIVGKYLLYLLVLLYFVNLSCKVVDFRNRRRSGHAA